MSSVPENPVVTAQSGISLELKDVRAGYGEGSVLRNVSLAARPNSITALVGPNGAGKSTLLKVASGLLKPQAGEVRLHGEAVTGQSPSWRARRGLCHIPEGRAVYRGLTVRDNLMMQARGTGSDDAIERAAEAFPVLGSRLSQRAGTLSGGEQQMLALAAAYIRRPSVLLVDEASLGLAPKIVDEVFAFLLRVQEEGLALLLVDQFVDRVVDVASDAYILRRGEIAYTGPAKDLKGQALEHYFGTAGTEPRTDSVPGAGLRQVPDGHAR